MFISSYRFTGMPVFTFFLYSEYNLLNVWNNFKRKTIIDQVSCNLALHPYRELLTYSRMQEFNAFINVCKFSQINRKLISMLYHK